MGCRLLGLPIRLAGFRVEGLGLVLLGLTGELVGLLVGFLVLLGCCTAGLLVGFFGIVLLTHWALSGLFDLGVIDCWVPLLLLGVSLGLLGHWVVGLLGCWLLGWAVKTFKAQFSAYVTPFVFEERRTGHAYEAWLS